MKRTQRGASNRNTPLRQAPEGPRKGLGQPRSRRLHDLRVRKEMKFVRQGAFFISLLSVLGDVAASVLAETENGL